MSEVKKITGEEPANPTGLWGQQQTPGMSLRTYIASQVMAQRISDGPVSPSVLESAAKVAVNSADVLIKALNTIPNPNK